MRHILIVGILLALVGCQNYVLPFQPRQPSRADDPRYNIPEQEQRGRGQATAAVEGFYVDSWKDLEDAAAALEQTGRVLPRTTNIPASVKDKLEADADTLRQDALKLGDAARARNVRDANEILQRINLK